MPDQRKGTASFRHRHVMIPTPDIPAIDPAKCVRISDGNPVPFDA
jgi:hypothetical protein